MNRAQQSLEHAQPSAAAMLPGVKRFKGRLNLRKLAQQDNANYPYLLESTALTEENTSSTHYDILFAYPQATLLLDKHQRLYLDGKQLDHDDFLHGLDRQWSQAADTHQTDSSLPFSGGWFLFLGYELAQQVEPRLRLRMPDDGFPVAIAVRIPAAVIYDHANDETILVCEAGYSQLAEIIEARLLEPEDPANRTDEISDTRVELDEQDPQRYLDSASRVRQYITDGDVFQVNLSRGWKGSRPPGLEPFDIYRRLSRDNPAPFSGIMQFSFGSIISSSPERLIRTRNKTVETRPIAGTRPRSHVHESDLAFKQELIAHPKERAEHVMLIDLERNDLGRICQPGSIHVDEMMVTESYAHVHHIVSNITGTLRDDVTPGEAIRAVFPGGTITGCPKERCMAIIAELEQESRSVYTGSAGYLNHNGDLDLNILIRTISITNDTVSLRTGAGLVFDSVPEKELEETRHKAKGLLLALGAMQA